MKKAADMTPRELSEAVAKICGWTTIETKEGCGIHGCKGPHFEVRRGKRSHGIIHPENRETAFPDYAGSLDAMATALEEIPAEKRVQYLSLVSDIATVAGDMGWGEHNATAIQRARAFVEAMTP